MKDQLLSLFGFTGGEKGVQSPALLSGTLAKKLTEYFEGKEIEEIAYLTALSGLLGKVAYSDFDVSAVERQSMAEILEREGELSPEDALHISTLVAECTKELAGIEDHRYYRMLNDHVEKAKKARILCALFSVAAANDSIAAEEDETIRRIAGNLHIVGPEYTAIRSGYFDKIDVLKN